VPGLNTGVAKVQGTGITDVCIATSSLLKDLGGNSSLLPRSIPISFSRRAIRTASQTPMILPHVLFACGSTGGEDGVGGIAWLALWLALLAHTLRARNEPQSA